MILPEPLPEQELVNIEARDKMSWVMKPRTSGVVSGLGHSGWNIDVHSPSRSSAMGNSGISGPIHRSDGVEYLDASHPLRRFLYARILFR